MEAKVKDLISQYEAEIRAALGYLEFSFQKVQNRKLPPPLNADPEELEVWESFASRYGRVTDIFVSKYVRLRVQQGDPAFRGETRDYLDQAEKIGLIPSANFWMSIREDRNKIAHQYSGPELQVLYKSLVEKTGALIADLRKIFP